MNIKIEDYLSEEEIKKIVTEEIKRHVRSCVGEVSVTHERSRVLLSIMAKSLAREGIQELIPNFKEYINEHIKEEISKLKLHDFFVANMGWRSEGNKIFNSIMENNRELIDAKIKELFNVRRKEK